MERPPVPGFRFPDRAVFCEVCWKWVSHKNQYDSHVLGQKHLALLAQAGRSGGSASAGEHGVCWTLQYAAFRLNRWKLPKPARVADMLVKQALSPFVHSTFASLVFALPTPTYTPNDSLWFAGDAVHCVADRVFWRRQDVPRGLLGDRVRVPAR